MERVRFITYRGQRIVLADVSDCKAQEVMDVVDHIPGVVTAEPPGSVLLLGDFSRSEVTREALEHIKIAAVFDRPHLKKSAWVCTDSFPRTLYETVKSFSARRIPLFGTREEALEYLVS